MPLPAFITIPFCFRFLDIKVSMFAAEERQKGDGHLLRDAICFLTLLCKSFLSVMKLACLLITTEKVAAINFI